MGRKNRLRAVFSYLVLGANLKSIIYIDGYNLFYGCLKHSGDKWLDLHELFFERILRSQNPASELVGIKFFTADIKAKVASNGDAAMAAQNAYHRALCTLYGDKLTIIKGYYSLEKARLLAYRKPPDKEHRVDVWRLEEKQSDVRMALEGYRDAARGTAEQLIFVSNDTDLAPALEAIREDFGNRHEIGVILPIRKSEKHHRPGNEQLSRHANWTRSHILPEELSCSQLPEKVPTNKKPILKPEYW